MPRKRNETESENPIMSRITKLLVERGRTDLELAGFLGVGTGTISHWKYNRRSTYLLYINQICEFLETDPNYLFWGSKNQNDMTGLDPIEEEMIKTYRSMDKERRDCVRNVLKLLSKSHNFEIK